MVQSFLKVFDQTLTAFHPSIRALNDPSGCHWDKSRLALGYFLGFGWLRCEFKPDLGHDLWVEFLQLCCELVRVIPPVKQNGNFGDIDGFSSKVVQVVAQQFNQALIIGYTRFSAVGKKRQTQSVHCQMSFDAIGAFVMTKPLGLHTGIARILHRLRIDY